MRFFLWKILQDGNEVLKVLRETYTILKKVVQKMGKSYKKCAPL